MGDRKDAQGRHIFQGGFLGLDNIGCFDRSAPLPTGGFIKQADGTAWMGDVFAQPHAHRARTRAAHEHPYEYHANGSTMSVSYQPAESNSGLFGGNSNWREPIWMSVNYLLIESLQKFHHYYGDDFKVECPTGSGQFMTIAEVADELSRRLSRLFLKDEDGQRPVLKYHPKLASDPHFKDYVLFHKYFHGDTGRGVGASHQTGRTGLVAKLLQPRVAMTKPGRVDGVSAPARPLLSRRTSIPEPATVEAT